MGVTLNKSTRRILTNTTTSGFLDIEDDYFNYDALLGAKFLNDVIPDFSYSLGYSLTPNHEESKYYKWEKKDFINFSLDNETFRDNKSSLNLNEYTVNKKVLSDDIKMMHEFIEFKYFKKVMKRNNNIIE